MKYLVIAAIGAVIIAFALELWGHLPIPSPLDIHPGHPKASLCTQTYTKARGMGFGEF